MMPETDRILAVIRAIRADRWKAQYRAKHREDAPEPTDKDLGFPMETLLVHWDTGYLLIDLAELMKLPQATRNKIYKLGGLSK